MSGGAPIDDPPLVLDTSLLAKVRKLLAKAEATDNANEAEAFSMKAAQLIAVHRLDPARLGGPAADDRLVSRQVVIGRGAYTRARLALLGAVVEHHGGQLAWRSGPDGTTAEVVGFAGDLEPALVLYESLHLQASSQLAGVRRATPAATQRWRRAFLFGFVARVGELLAATSREAAATHRETTPDRALPARRDRDAEVREFAEVAFGPTVAARTPRPAVAGGWVQGQRAAGGADLGRDRLRSRRALGRGGR